MTATSVTRVVRHDLAARRASVVDIEQVTPRYRRIVVTGNQLSGFQTLDADDHFKLALPTPGTSEPILPTFGPNGAAFPESAERPVVRDYTPRRFDPESNRLTIDFVQHGDGPASNWAEQAEIGQSIGVMGPRGSHLLTQAFDWYLLIGDETMLPSIARRLEEATPDQHFLALIEVANSAEVQSIETRTNADIHWVTRDGSEAGTSSILETTLRGLSFPPGEFFAWAGGEANTLRSIRRYLVRERGIDPRLLSFSGHWKRGVADHDHHEPIED